MSGYYWVQAPRRSDTKPRYYKQDLTSTGGGLIN